MNQRPALVQQTASLADEGMARRILNPLARGSQKFPGVPLSFNQRAFLFVPTPYERAIASPITPRATVSCPMCAIPFSLLADAGTRTLYITAMVSPDVRCASNISFQPTRLCARRLSSRLSPGSGAPLPCPLTMSSRSAGRTTPDLIRPWRPRYPSKVTHSLTKWVFSSFMCTRPRLPPILEPKYSYLSDSRVLLGSVSFQPMLRIQLVTPLVALGVLLGSS